MIRATLTLLCAVLATAAMASGQTEPAITVDGSPVANQAVGRTVLTLPIAPPPTGNYANISQSIQQDMVADLTTLTKARVIAPVGIQPATSAQAALDEARQHNADFVVWGQSQVSGNQLRVTGQVLQVSDGHPLAGIKATAPVDDLFPLEDSLSAQVARALPAPIGLVTPPPQTQSAPQAGTVSQPPAPSTTAAPAPDNGNPYYSYTETVPQTYYDYNTYYYPGYWSPYWGYWGYPYIGIGIYGGWWGHGWYGGHYWGRPYGGFYGRGYGGFRAGGFAARGGGFAGGHGGGGGGGHR